MKLLYKSAIEPILIVDSTRCLDFISYIPIYFRLTRLKSLYGRHHNLVDRYETTMSQMTMNLLLFM